MYPISKDHSLTHSLGAHWLKGRLSKDHTRKNAKRGKNNSLFFKDREPKQNHILSRGTYHYSPYIGCSLARPSLPSFFLRSPLSPLVFPSLAPLSLNNLVPGARFSFGQHQYSQLDNVTLVGPFQGFICFPGSPRARKKWRTRPLDQGRLLRRRCLGSSSGGGKIA